MFNSFFRIVLLCAVFATSNTIYCQNDGRTNQTENPLPKNARLKTINFKSSDYAALGYISNNQFIEGHEITFYSIRPDTYKITAIANPIINGVHFKKYGMSYLKSTIIRKTDSKLFLEGIFEISNTFNGIGLTTKPKEATDLKIKTRDIILINGFFENPTNQISIQKMLEDNYNLKIEFEDRTIECTINKEYIEKKTFPIVDRIITSSDKYIYEFTETSSNLFNIKNYDDVLLKSDKMKITFKNGDFFEGKISVCSLDDKYIPSIGKYTFAKGEIFEGDIQKKFYYDYFHLAIPTDGKIIFTDGSEENGDWLKKYNVSENDLSAANTLTEKHTLAQKLFNERQYKLADEKNKLKQKEEQNRIAENNKRNSLIKKYGEHIGGLLSKREVEVGMTMAMIIEVFPKDYFIVKKSVINGQVIEEWLFSKEKMFKDFTNKSNDPNINIVAMLIIDNPELIGGKEFPIERLVFVDNILKDIYYTAN